jgi:hypothetical protein
MTGSDMGMQKHQNFSGVGAYPPPPRSEVSFNLSEAPQDGGAYQSTFRDNAVDNFDSA